MTTLQLFSFCHTHVVVVRQAVTSLIPFQSDKADIHIPSLISDINSLFVLIFLNISILMNVNAKVSLSI